MKMHADKKIWSVLSDLIHKTLINMLHLSTGNVGVLNSLPFLISSDSSYI